MFPRHPVISVPAPDLGGGAHTFTFRTIRRKRSTINMFTSRVMSHRDSGPYCSGFLGRPRSHVREYRGAEGLGDEAAGSNSHCMDTRPESSHWVGG